MPHPYSAFNSRTARIRRTAASPLLTTAIRLGNLTVDGSDIRPVYVPRPEPKMQPALRRQPVLTTEQVASDRHGRRSVFATVPIGHQQPRSTWCSGQAQSWTRLVLSQGRSRRYLRVCPRSPVWRRCPTCRRSVSVDARWGSFRIAVSVSVTSVAVAVSGGPRGGRSRSGRAGSPRKMSRASASTEARERRLVESTLDLAEIRRWTP